MKTKASSLARAAYEDLRASLSTAHRPPFRGNLTRVSRHNKTYWYDSYRIGTVVKKRYVGEDSPLLQSQARVHEANRARAFREAKARSLRVKLLKAEGFRGPGSAIGSFLTAASSADLFEHGLMVIGTQAFKCYENHLGFIFNKSEEQALGLSELDRVDLAIAAPGSQEFTDSFCDFCFRATDDDANAYLWTHSRQAVQFRFFGASVSGTEGFLPVGPSGAELRMMRYLRFLMKDPIDVVCAYRSGIRIKAPRPDRFAVHKLILANRRKHEDPETALRDARQAAALIEVLNDVDPVGLRETLEEALGRGKTWQSHIIGTLSRLPETVELLEKT
ncbi:MAG: GSU2403 family nucleotidyltransferase fold protein [Pseudomonadota bacterium]